MSKLSIILLLTLELGCLEGLLVVFLSLKLYIYGWKPNFQILFHHNLVFCPDIDDDVFEMACNSYMKVVQKLEKHGDFLFSLILEKLVNRFPNEVKYKRQLGLDYVRRNENLKEAIKLFEDIWNVVSSANNSVNKVVELGRSFIKMRNRR